MPETYESLKLIVEGTINGRGVSIKKDCPYPVSRQERIERAQAISEAVVRYDQYDPINISQLPGHALKIAEAIMFDLQDDMAETIRSVFDPGNIATPYVDYDRSDNFAGMSKTRRRKLYLPVFTEHDQDFDFTSPDLSRLFQVRNGDALKLHWMLITKSSNEDLLPDKLDELRPLAQIFHHIITDVEDVEVIKPVSSGLSKPQILSSLINRQKMIRDPREIDKGNCKAGYHLKITGIRLGKMDYEEIDVSVHFETMEEAMREAESIYNGDMSALMERATSIFDKKMDSILHPEENGRPRISFKPVILGFDEKGDSLGMNCMVDKDGRPLLGGKPTHWILFHEKEKTQQPFVLKP